jgi:hypothetical protein
MVRRVRDAIRPNGDRDDSGRVGLPNEREDAVLGPGFDYLGCNVPTNSSSATFA